MPKPLAQLEPAQIAAMVQRMMREAPRGQPMDAEMLRELGVSIPQALRLVEQGWLSRLSAGAYLLTGDIPSKEGAIAYLSRRIPGLHVGGKTALNWQGVRHNIAFRERVVLWGQANYPFSDWVENATLFGYQTTRLFDDRVPYGKWLQSVPGHHPEILVSAPERALVELVSQLGRGQSLEEVQNLMVTMRNLRSSILDEVLKHCVRVTVVRKVCKLGLDSGFDWGQSLQKHVSRHTSKRS